MLEHPEIETSSDVDLPSRLELTKPEHYKGIFYVRLSTLPDAQKESIRSSHYRERIVIIIQDDCLLSDCIIYSDYIEWSTEHNQKQAFF